MSESPPTTPIRLSDPRVKHPLRAPDGSVIEGQVHLSAYIDHPKFKVGDFTYYHDTREIQDYAQTLAPYLFPFSKERLEIGKFCQIAQGVQFITASANHEMNRISTYPFESFDPDHVWSYLSSKPAGKDTIVGSDCWIGREAMLLPGAQLGHGVIVGARAVVSGRVPDYALVAGNPAKVIRMRYSPAEIQTLLELQWWSWPEAKIQSALELLLTQDIQALAGFERNWEGCGPTD